MKKLDAIVTIVLLLLAFAVYSQSAGFGIINIDDYEYLVRSKAITSGFSLAGLSWSFNSVEHAMWTPLTWISYMFDFSLFGQDCWGAMHIHNAVLHAINAALLFFLLKLLLVTTSESAIKTTLIAALGAAIWALHPLRVESVAWLSSRKDVLSLMFELAAMICWISANTKNKVDGRFLAKYLAALMFFVLGAMAKSSVMTMPILLLSLDVFILRKIRPWMYFVPGVMMVAIAIEASASQSAGGATVSMAAQPLFYRILNAMSAFGIYLKNSLLPINLAPQCMSKFPSLPKALSFGMFVSGITAAYVIGNGWTLWRKRMALFNKVSSSSEGEWTYSGDRNWLLAGVLWFCFGIAPFLGIAKFGYHAFADRFTYIPAIGLSLIVVALVSRFKCASAILLPIAIAVLSVLTWRQVEVWQSDKTVWRQTLKVDGDDNAMAHNGQGMYAFEIDHDLETACIEFAKVRELNEIVYWNCCQVHVYALCELERFEEAENALVWFRKAVRKIQKKKSAAINEPYGALENEPRDVGNHVHAELAYALCDPKQREWAQERISLALDMGNISPSLGYLIYRYGVLAENKSVETLGLETIKRAPKTDYLQFRYLTRKDT